MEGCSINTIERVAEVHHTTILKLLVLVGEKCAKLMGRMVVNVPVTDVQCDEIWGFVQKKEAHKWPWEAHDNSVGDAYCFVAIERRSKLILNFALGRRDQATTDQLWAAYCLWFAFYNFCRVHKTLRITPAMASGLTDRVWGLADLVAA